MGNFTSRVIPIIVGICFALAVILFLIAKPASFSNSLYKSSQTPSNNSVSIDKISNLESEITDLKQEQSKQNLDISTLQASLNEPKSVSSQKQVLSTASIKGSNFTTSSFEYTSMGMFLNIKCSVNCLLWINFF